MNVLYEDNHLLAINKPAGIATMGDPGEETIHSWGCDYIRQKYQKPGKVFLGIVSRLDKPTTGALVLARTSKAASRLSQQFAAKTTPAEGGKSKYPAAEKVYLAAVDGRLDVDEVWQDHCINDETAKRMRVVSADHPEAKFSQSRVKTIGITEHHSLLAIHLQTGRKHQIRWQCASRNHPVLGEFKYAPRLVSHPGARQNPMSASIRGSRDALAIGLHSWILLIEHPTLRDVVPLYAPPSAAWRELFPETLGSRGATENLSKQMQTEFCLRESAGG